MKLEPSFRIQPGFIYLAPVLDIGFLLGMFFLFQGAFLLQPGIAIQAPRSPFLLAPQTNPRVLSITGAPVPKVYFDNQAVNLEELFAEWSKPGSPRPGSLIIKADVDAPYAMVIGAATLAIEAGIPVVLATDDRNGNGEGLQ